jgi:carboxypeptidase Q
VLIGAHLDSWDVGCGAHDDGAGVVEVIEAMRALAALGKAPRRTIRAVLYDNEEHGLSGGKAYAAAHGTEPHTVAMETDLGGGVPLAWAMSGTDEQRAWLTTTMAPLGIPVEGDGGGADISTLEDAGVLLVGLRPDDSHYFDVHHTHADTVDKVDPDALRAATGAVAGFAWLAANAP